MPPKKLTLKPKKLNLHTLAAKLARMDDPRNVNIDIIDVKLTLAHLGQVIRSSTAVEALDILNAIAGRAGK